MDLLDAIISQAWQFCIFQFMDMGSCMRACSKRIIACMKAKGGYTEYKETNKVYIHYSTHIRSFPTSGSFHFYQKFGLTAI